MTRRHPLALHEGSAVIVCDDWIISGLDYERDCLRRGIEPETYRFEPPKGTQTVEEVIDLIGTLDIARVGFLWQKYTPYCYCPDCTARRAQGCDCPDCTPT